MVRLVGGRVETYPPACPDKGLLLLLPAGDEWDGIVIWPRVPGVTSARNLCR